MTDPFEAMLASARAASDQSFAFWKDHLRGVVEAYRKYMDRADRDALLNGMVRTVVESDNPREALAYQLVVAIDMLARRP